MKRVSIMHINWIHLALTVIVVVGLLLFFSNRIMNFFIFYPQARFDSLPSNWGLEHEDILFGGNDGTKLHGWFFQGKKGEPLILFCHGNAGNISHCLPIVEMMRKRDLNVFIFDYRGYGRSEGSPNEKGIYKDGLAAYDHILKTKGVSPEEVVPFGHSLGATVAIEIASKRRIKALILESAFTSLKDMAKTIYIFKPFARLLGPDYNNLEKIRHISKPKLIIHGEQDEIVPFSLGEKIFDAASQPKYFLPLAKAGHNDIHLVGGERYADIIVSFAKDLKGP